jgi:ankyrin repeat protein
VAAILAAVKAGENVNEVEAAGNTPLHSAAYEGWLEGAELLISLGAKVQSCTAGCTTCIFFTKIFYRMRRSDMLIIINNPETREQLQRCCRVLVWIQD